MGYRQRRLVMQESADLHQMLTHQRFALLYQADILLILLR